MAKIHQLDPKHKALLSDHSSGYWQIQSLHPSKKYKRKVVFTNDFGDMLKNSTNKRKIFRQQKNFGDFATHGYIFSNVEFIKLLECSDPSVERLNEAIDLLNKIFADKKQAAWDAGYLKRFGKPFGGKYVPKHPRGPWSTWEWSFQHPVYGKYEHVIHFDIGGERIGKPRALFCQHFNLSPGQMYNLAGGKIDEHRGWTRIRKPRRLTKPEAVALKVKLLKRDASS